MALLGAVALAAGCTGDDLAFPDPTEVGAGPFPEGADLGGWDAVFASVTTEERGGLLCRSYLRFDPDGTVTYAGVGCDRPGADLDWLDPAESDVDRGDYAVRGDLVSARIVLHDVVTDSFSLRLLRGERCLGRLVLQVPGETGYLGVPSPLTEPVLTYEQVSRPVLPETEQGCDAAPFEVVSRSIVALAGRETAVEVATDPGVACSLAYTGPDDTAWPADAGADIVAGADGRCRWQFPVGDSPGEATFTVTIDEIAQPFGIEIR